MTIEHWQKLCPANTHVLVQCTLPDQPGWDMPGTPTAASAFRQAGTIQGDSEAGLREFGSAAAACSNSAAVLAGNAGTSSD